MFCASITDFKFSQTGVTHLFGGDATFEVQMIPIEKRGDGRWLLQGGRCVALGDRWLLLGDRWLLIGGRRTLLGERWLLLGDRYLLTR